MLDNGKQFLHDNFVFNVNRNFLRPCTFHPNVHLTAALILLSINLILKKSYLILKNLKKLVWTILKIHLFPTDVENETRSDVRFSVLHNVDTTSMSDVETTLIQRCATSNQRCFDVVQRCFNVDYNLILTFFQYDLDVI